MASIILITPSSFISASVWSKLPGLSLTRNYCTNVTSSILRTPSLFTSLVLCQEKVQIKCNQFSLCLAKLNLLFLSHNLLDFSDILPHIGLGINTHNGCEYVLYCKMFLCIQKSTYMHVYSPYRFQELCRRF